MHHSCREDFRWRAHLRAWIDKASHRWGWGHFCGVVDQIFWNLICDFEFFFGLWLGFIRLLVGHLDISIFLRSHTIAVLMFDYNSFLNNCLRSLDNNSFNYSRLSNLLLLDRIVLLFFRCLRRWRRRFFRVWALTHLAPCLPQHLFLCWWLLLNDWNLNNRLYLNLKTVFNMLIITADHFLIFFVIGTFILLVVFLILVGWFLITTLIHLLLLLGWWGFSQK